MRKYLLVILLIGFWGCATTTGTYIPPTIVIKPNFSPKDYKVAMLPTKNNGNPDKLLNYDVAGKFQMGFREMGFKVVNYQITESIMRDMDLEPDANLSATQLKEIQEKLNCNAVCLSSVENIHMPSFGSGGVNAYGGRASTVGETYSPSSESLSIIDYTTFETLVDVHIRRSSGKSMSSSIIAELKKKFNYMWANPTK